MEETRSADRQQEGVQADALPEVIETALRSCIRRALEKNQDGSLVGPISAPLTRGQLADMESQLLRDSADALAKMVQVRDVLVRLHRGDPRGQQAIEDINQKIVERQENIRRWSEELRVTLD